ncbi:hypothetical protein [Methyloglobulus sp.]
MRRICFGMAVCSRETTLRLCYYFQRVTGYAQSGSHTYLAERGHPYGG